MPRPVLEESRIHPAVRARVCAHHRDIVDEVEAAVRAHPVVVVGKQGNPYPRQARRLQQDVGIAHHALETAAISANGAATTR